MPVPKPNKDEKKEDYISRFMSDPKMIEEYPDQKQRLAVAYSEFGEKQNASESLEFDEQSAKEIAEHLGIDFSSFTLEEFLKGIQEETEHAHVVDYDPYKLGEIAVDHLKKDPKYYTNEENRKNRVNAKSWPKPFDLKFLEAGTANYYDQGIALLRKETIDKCMNTFIGKPIIITHQVVTPENMEKIAQGYIHEVYFCSEDGWYHAKGLIHGDEGKEKIEAGWQASCDYTSTSEDFTGGEWHANHYDSEILGFIGNNIAIVPDPRYEGAKIILNSKGDDNMLWRKNSKEEEKKEDEKKSEDEKSTEEKERKENDMGKSCGNSKKLNGKQFVKINGKDVSVEDMAKYHKDEEDDREFLNDDDEVELENGKKVKVNSLKKSYINAMKETESEKKEEEIEKKEIKDEEAKEKGVKQNSKVDFHQHLNNLSKKSDNPPVMGYRSKAAQYEAGKKY